MRRSSPDSNTAAAAWGTRLAREILERYGADIERLRAEHGWQVKLEAEAPPGLLPAPVARWEGDTRTIRLFLAPLRLLPVPLPHALALACAHEMFHALWPAPLLLPGAPVFSRAQEEVAAAAFAENLCLTLEGPLCIFAGVHPGQSEMAGRTSGAP